MRILLADDDHRVRGALQLLLECNANWSVVGESTDAESLLAHAQAIGADLVLLDWELPGRSDALLPQRLRVVADGIKVVALSSKQESREEALSAGADAFVSKTESAEHLLDTLHTLTQTTDQTSVPGQPKGEQTPKGEKSDKGNGDSSCGL